jgi:hemerythrin-like domain-containing protein
VSLEEQSKQEKDDHGAETVWKEDYLLFPMANCKVLSTEDQITLSERFEAADAAMGGDVLLRFEQVAAELEKRVYAS